MRHLIVERGLADQLMVDSCGTGSWHAGEAPHHGSQQVAVSHGLDISQQRSRQLQQSDINQFDWLIAMDRSNFNGIKRLDRNGEKEERIVMLLDYAGPNTPADVPDPYYEGGFERVYDVIYEGCEGLLDHIVDNS